MRKIILNIVFLFILCSHVAAQAKADAILNAAYLIESLQKLDLQGFNTQQNLIYRYVFKDKDESKLKNLKADMVAQTYSFSSLTYYEGDRMFTLEVRKSELLTQQAVLAKDQILKQLANKYVIKSYGLFGPYLADMTEPKISNDAFLKYYKIIKGNELFELGYKLQALRINDKAILVFKECIKQNIKADTAGFVLGALLINDRKMDEGILQIEQAVKYNPRYFTAITTLASQYFTYYNNFEKSLLYFQQADKLNPKNENIIYMIAASQFNLKDYNKALENCKKVLEINSKNESANQLLEMLKGKVH